VKTEIHPWDCNCDFCHSAAEEGVGYLGPGGGRIIFEITCYYSYSSVRSRVNVEVEEAPSRDSLQRLNAAIARILRYEIEQAIPGAVVGE
jgi:hypothetical protein